MSSIFILLLGLKTIIFCNKSTKGSLNSLRKFEALEVDDSFNYFIIDLQPSDSSEVISSSVGRPVNWQIL
jgi:hypothetical protein